MNGLVVDRVRGFMKRYDQAAPTLFSRDPSSLRIGSETYEIADIGMRLLVPRELARAHSFDDGLALERDVHGKAVTRTDQVRLVGNSVPRDLAREVVRANIASERVVAA